MPTGTFISADDMRHHMNVVLTEAISETEQTLREELAADGYNLETIQKNGFDLLNQLQEKARSLREQTTIEEQIREETTTKAGIMQELLTSIKDAP